MHLIDLNVQNGIYGIFSGNFSLDHNLDLDVLLLLCQVCQNLARVVEN